MAIDTIDIREARTSLSRLVDRVQAGETIAITRHGKKVALLVPVQQDRSNARRTIDRLRQDRKGSRLSSLQVRDLRDQGRP